MANRSAEKRSEQELVLGLKNRDASAFSYLVKNYSYALKKAIDKPDVSGFVDDMLQDIFVKIWECIHNFDATKGRLFTWMVTIARKTAGGFRLSKSYKKAQLTNTIDDYLDVHPYMIDQDDHLNEHFGTINLLELAEKYSPTHSGLIKSYLQGYRYSEISKQEGLKIHVVKNRMNKSLEKIKEALRADFVYLQNQSFTAVKSVKENVEKNSAKLDLGRKVKNLKAEGRKMKYIANNVGFSIATCHNALRYFNESENSDVVAPTLEQEKTRIGKKIARLRLKNLSMKAISQKLKVSVSGCYACLRYLDEVNESKKDYGAYLKKMREIAKMARQLQQEGKSHDAVAKAIGVHPDTCYNALRMFKPK